MQDQDGRKHHGANPAKPQSKRPDSQDRQDHIGPGRAPLLDRQDLAGLAECLQTPEIVLVGLPYTPELAERRGFSRLPGRSRPPIVLRLQRECLRMVGSKGNAYCRTTIRALSHSFSR
jgi:hypothetical protein